MFYNYSFHVRFIHLIGSYVGKTTSTDSSSPPDEILRRLVKEGWLEINTLYCEYHLTKKAQDVFYKKF